MMGMSSASITVLESQRVMKAGTYRRMNYLPELSL